MPLIGVGGAAAGGGGGTCCTRVGSLAQTDDVSGLADLFVNSPAVNVASGNLLVVLCRAPSSVINAPTDTAGNTFTSIVASSGAGGSIALFYAKNTTANASDVVACNFVTSQAFRSVLVMQYSGASTTAPLDQSCTGSASATTSVSCSASITTTVAKEVVVGGATADNSSNTFTAGTGFTLQTTNPKMSAIEDDLLTSTATLTPSISAGTQNWQFVAGSFK